MRGRNFGDQHTNGTLPKPTKSIGNEVNVCEKKTVTHFTKLQWQWQDIRFEIKLIYTLGFVKFPLSSPTRYHFQLSLVQFGRSATLP